jgi:hypothetical protein
MTVNNQLGTIWKEMIVPCSRTLSQNLPGGTEKTAILRLFEVLAVTTILIKKLPLQ